MDSEKDKLTIEEQRLEIAELKTRIGAFQDEENRSKEKIQQQKDELIDAEEKYQKMHAHLFQEIINHKEKIQRPMHEEKKNNVAIIIVTYNNSQLIKKQVQCIRRFCKDEHDIIIVDNSTDGDTIAAIKYYNDTELHCKYLKTDATSKNGSDSHAFAANLSYLKYKDDYGFIFYLDHDCFPTRDFSVKELLAGKIMTGLGQRKGELEYFWQGCVMWDNAKIDRNLINFSTSHELGLDTGGMLHLVIQKYGKELCPFFNEIHVQNPNFTKTFYNFYALINEGGFMHFINSSNWANSDSHEERMNSLLSILQNKINNG